MCLSDRSSDRQITEQQASCPAAKVRVTGRTFDGTGKCRSEQEVRQCQRKFTV